MRRGQVWIETVLYTLIGLSLLGLVLAFVMPKINESKDRTAVEQSINSLNMIDEKMDAVLQYPGNVRVIDFSLKRGELVISPSSNSIYIIMEGLTKPYSEPGVVVPFGNVGIRSDIVNKENRVVLLLNYTNKVDLQYAEKEIDKKFGVASTPYRLSLSSLPAKNGLEVVSIEDISGR